MEFADVEHTEQYRNLMGKATAKDSESDWAAALFLLSSPMLARRCAKHVKPRKISFTELMEETKPWSSSEKALVRLAAALLNNSWKCDINDAFWSLDTDNTELALEALRIRWQ